jgi:hypothetical protein
MTTAKATDPRLNVDVQPTAPELAAGVNHRLAIKAILMAALNVIHSISPAMSVPCDLPPGRDKIGVLEYT